MQERRTLRRVRMKSIFVSFDEIGWYCLREILRMGGEVTGIFTLTDERLARVSGAKPFDGLAEEFGVPLYKIRNINDEEVISAVRDCAPDISFVVGWSQLVKREFIDLAAYTCVGMHPTLLPRHRGRAPLPWAIIMGLKKTGVTMFHIDVEADNGDIIGQVEVDIDFHDNAASLYRKTLDAHVDLIREYWPLLARGEAPRIKQDEARASYWPKRTPADGIIDWNTRAVNLYDWIRALSEPYPGAFTFIGGKKLFIWKAEIVEGVDADAAPGEVVGTDELGAVVGTGEGLIRIRSLQLDGGERLDDGKIGGASILEKGKVLG